MNIYWSHNKKSEYKYTLYLINSADFAIPFHLDIGVDNIEKNHRKDKVNKNENKNKPKT